MNILQQEDQIKGMPDDRLFTEAKQPSGQVPQFLVISEIQRRTDMRKRFQNQQEQPQGTVADQVVQEGIGSMQPQPQQGGMPPQQMAQGGVASAYNRRHNGYAGGGIVRMSEGMRPTDNPAYAPDSVQAARDAVNWKVDDRGSPSPWGFSIPKFNMYRMFNAMIGEDRWDDEGNKAEGGIPSVTGGTAGGGGGGGGGGIPSVGPVPPPGGDTDLPDQLILPGDEMVTPEAWQAAIAAEGAAEKTTTGSAEVQATDDARVQSKPTAGITSLSRAPSEAEQMLMDMVGQDGPAVPDMSDLIADQKKDAWSHALVQLGAGIAGNDMAGGLEKAGLVGMAAKKEAREMEEQALLLKHKADQDILQRDISILGKVAGIEAQKWRARIERAIQTGRDDNETIRLVKAAVDDVMKDAIIMPRTGEDGKPIESMYNAKLREVARLYDEWLPASVKASRGLGDFVNATMQTATQAGGVKTLPEGADGTAWYNSLPSGTVYMNPTTGQPQRKP